MTFSFDVVEPIVQTQDPTRMEMIFRAGVGTAHGTLQSGDQIVEAIMFRGGNRHGHYTNNGDETIFLVANNKATDLTFASPDRRHRRYCSPDFNTFLMSITTPQTCAARLKAFPFNATHRRCSATFKRFGIGSSTTGDVGTFAIDNVLVVSGVSFEQNVGPTCILGDADCNNIVDLADFEPIRANFRNAGNLARPG